MKNKNNKNNPFANLPRKEKKIVEKAILSNSEPLLSQIIKKCSNFGEVGTLPNLEKMYGKKKAKEMTHLINNIMNDSSICYGRSDDKIKNNLVYENIDLKKRIEELKEEISELKSK